MSNSVLAFPEKSEYWSIVDDGGNILASGRLTPDLQLTSANPVIVHDANQNQYLNSINGIGAAGLPLPEAGTELTAGEIYVWDAQNVMVRQDHIRTADDPDTVPALFSVYREATDEMLWIPNEQVLVGDDRIFDGQKYDCMQGHQTQEGWEPPAVPALWQLVVEPSDEWQAGVVYAVDDPTTYEAIDYICLQGHTAQAGWEPPNAPALWSAT